ncbi:MAG: hypothetical protein OHK0015_32950 [Chloroflexi bacterium OHK40]
MALKRAAMEGGACLRGLPLPWERPHRRTGVTPARAGVPSVTFEGAEGLLHQFNVSRPHGRASRA